MSAQLRPRVNDESPRIPQGDSGRFRALIRSLWCRLQDLNLQPPYYKYGALPIAPSRQSIQCIGGARPGGYGVADGDGAGEAGGVGVGVGAGVSVCVR